MSAALTASAREQAYRGPTRWPLTVAAYHALGELGHIPEKTELLYGRVYPKTPKSPLHSLLVMRLLKWLHALVPPGWTVRAEQPLTLADSEPEPDADVVRGALEDFGRQHPTTAELAIGVCVRSHDYDREKLPAYAAGGVREVWLVLGPEQAVEVHRRPQAGRYAETFTLGRQAQLVCAGRPEVRVSVAELFRT
jgi:Uma2 family endonuclease